MQDMAFMNQPEFIYSFIDIDHNGKPWVNDHQLEFTTMQPTQL
jgi:hypothetical protein